MSERSITCRLDSAMARDDAVTPESYVLIRGGPPRRSFRERLERAIALLHRIIGAPDYDAYLRHHRRAHPDEAPLSKADFVNQHFTDKYSRPGTRCC